MENDGGTRYLKQLSMLLPNTSEGQELLALITKAAESANKDEATASFAAGMGWGEGISGYIYATVPIVLHSWFRHSNDYASSVTDLIMCGGDTDTAAAIAGAIVGAGVGVTGIPRAWLDGLMEWPCSVRWMERLAAQLTVAVNDMSPQKTVGPALPLVLMRNSLFLAIVLGHGFRRLIPPY
jgi:ADP-ribosylglycohydrolase